jgi:hypothetical protein
MHTKRNFPRLIVRASVLAALTTAVSELARAGLIGSGFTDGKLYDVSTTTGAATSPRPLGIGWALSFSPNGTLYGVTQGGGTPTSNTLYTVNPTSGVSIPIATTSPGIGTEGDIAFDPTSGVLYAVDGTGSVFTINTSNGIGTVIGSVPGAQDLSAMAFDSSGNLYVVDTAATTLIRINKFNASIILTVNLVPPPNGGVAGLAFDPSSGLCYLASGLGTTNNLYRVTTTTGAMQLVGPLTGTADGLAAITFTPIASTFYPFCFGDGFPLDCPCGNNGLPDRGCQNSASTGGAKLTGSGNASLSSDTVVLTSAGELPTSLSIFLQGTTVIGPTFFGDGLRCITGSLKRLYAKNAVAGTVSAPQGIEPKISSRSAALGDPIPIGATRVYQVYYRDPNLSFCSSPQGDAFNVSNAVGVAWGS